MIPQKLRNLGAVGAVLVNAKFQVLRERFVELLVLLLVLIVARKHRREDKKNKETDGPHPRI